MRKFFSWAATYVFVLVTWVFFRAQNFSTAWTYLQKLAFANARGIEWYYVQAMVVIALGAALHIAVVMRDDRELVIDFRRPIMWGVAVGMMIVILLYSPFGNSPFIYFQF